MPLSEIEVCSCFCLCEHDPDCATDAVSAAASEAFLHICGADRLVQVITLVGESGRVVDFLDVVQAVRMVYICCSAVD
jgi:hypothetical protein